MVAEKNAAFVESWNAMAVQALLANQALAASFFKSFFAAARGKKPSAADRQHSFSALRLAFWARALHLCTEKQSPTPSVFVEQSCARKEVE